MKKSSILILLLIAMILTISAVSAADTNDTSDSPIQAVEETTIESVDSDAVDNVLTANNNADVLEAGEGNFTELQNTINGANSIILSKDYNRVDGEQEIEINSNVNIIGNGHAIDAYNLGGIFKVASGVSLMLNDVTLINGNTQNGGAIFNQGGTITLVNCKLIRNTVEYRGAIYNEGGSLTLTGVTISDNNVVNRDSDSYGGAAIYSNGGTILIEGSTVTNNLKNIVPRGGTDSYAGDICCGAIRTSGELTVSNTRFENNSGAFGGAISTFDDNSILTVSGSTFVDNTAFIGGAIYSQGKYTISNSNFIGNKARGTGDDEEDCALGGAITTNGTDATSTISNCVFEENTAANGGAIYSIAGVVDGCTFTDNDADATYAGTYNGQTNEVGGIGDAIYSEQTITISNSGFENNGIYVKDSKVSGSSFDNSIIEVVNSGTLVVYNNTHNNNEFDIIGDNSSNVYYNGLGNYPRVKDVNFYFNATSFTDLQAFVNSGSIATLKLSNNVTKLTSEWDQFKNGIEIDKDITIDAQGNEIRANGDGIIFTIAEGVNFTLKNAKLVGAATNAIVNNGQLILDVTSPNTFSNVGQYAVENKGVVSEENMATFTQLYTLIHMVDGGQLFIGKSIIKKTVDERAEYENGILIDKFLSITGDNGSAITADDHGQILRLVDGAVLFVNNIAFTKASGDIGGAIYVSEGSKLIASHSLFSNNKATMGAAIYSEGDVSIDNSEFYYNTGAGTIINMNGTLYIYETNLFQNDVGTNLYVQGTVTTTGETLIVNSHFKNNTAGIGAAITSLGNLNNSTYTLEIQNSTFVQNYAYNHGGAIFVNASNLRVIQSTFDSNKARNNGGAIIVTGDESSAEIKDSLFNKNEAVIGTVYLNVNVDSIVDNCTFTNNNVNMGSALFLESYDDATITVSNSIFAGNPNTVFTIYNAGKLALSNNTVNKNYAEIHNNGSGIITSNLKAVVLGNSTVSVDNNEVTLIAQLMDDNGNLIWDDDANFTVDGVNVPVQAFVFDNIQVYKANYTLPQLDVYTVGFVTKNPNVDVYTGTISYITGTYTDLYNRLAAAQYGFLELPYDFKYDENVDGDKFPEGIIINKNLYINGKGVTISGDNSHRIFKVDGAIFVTLANVTLVNGSADYGGAVYVAQNSGFTPLSINFINNTAIYQGGAIYSEGTLQVNDGLFDGNDISLRNVDNSLNGGSAIFNNGGTLLVNHTKFTNNLKNIVVRNGVLGDKVLGAIATTGKANITDSYFANNTGCWGGAIAIIDNSNNVLITNNKFEGNNATFGGAIYVISADVNITNCDFIDNNAVGKTDIDNQGGAIYVGGESKTQITGSTFTGNTADNGGAVYTDSDDEDVLIDDCTFTTNIAKNGGAVFNNAIAIPLTISNSKFTNNLAFENDGDAISNDGFLILSKNQINTEEAEIYSGEGIILSEMNVDILNNETITFSGTIVLTAKIVDDNNNLIEETKFKFIVGDDELPAVYNKNSGFHEAEYVNDQAGIYLVNITYADGEDKNVTVKTATLVNIKGTFTDLQQLIDDGNTNLQYDFAYVEAIDGDNFIDGVVIDKSTMINGNGHKIDAKHYNRIFNIKENNVVSLNNITLVNGIADEGAAIYSSRGVTLTVSNLNFTNNSAYYRGGAIYSESYLTIYNSVFDQNNIIFDIEEETGGAAIYQSYEYLTVIGSNFTKNLYDFDTADAKSVGGAILTSADTTIRGSYFAKNGGAVGGAIYAIGNAESNPKSLFIRNSVFDSNFALDAGAIYGDYVDLDLADSTFYGNIALSTTTGDQAAKGGAIALSNGYARITGSVFDSNIAVLGGALSLNGVEGSDVNNCTFINNIADNGGAIYANSTDGSIINIFNSKFSDNTAETNGSAIFNVGELYLSGNTINTTYAEVYNEGIISSYLKATFLDNQTLSAEMGNTFVLYATLVDDMDNAVYDSKFRFTVNDEAIEYVYYDAPNALYLTEYYIETAGLKVVSTNSSYRGIVKYIGIIDVPKSNVTLLISAIDIVEGETAVITINVYGVNDIPLNTVVKVLANNTLHDVVVTNGKGILPITGLEAGSYPTFALFDGDDNYNIAYNSTNFFVKYLTELTILSEPVYDFGEIEIVFDLYDSHDEPVTGFIVVTVGGETYNVLIDNGFGELILNSVDAGEYTLIASYEGTNIYSPAINQTTFKVKRETEFEVTIEGTYPNATITIHGTNGKYNVTIGDEVYEVNVELNTGILDINIGAGDYEAVVTYADDNDYSQLSKDVSFTIEKAVPAMETNITGDIIIGALGVEINVTLPADATGLINVRIDGVLIAVGSQTDGIFTAEVPANLLTVGQHIYTVDYAGNDNYTEANALEIFNVNKYPTTLVVDVEPAYNYGDSIIILFTLEDIRGQPVTDVVNVLINDDPYTALINDGQGILILETQDPGVYTVVSSYPGNEIFNATVGNEVSFKVKQITEFEVTIEGTYPDATITIVGQKGKYNVTIDDNEYEVIVEMGSGVLPINLPAGDYIAEVTYAEDNEYSQTTHLVPFTVEKALPTIDTTITEDIEVDQEGVQIHISIPEDLTGIITVKVDDTPITIGGFPVEASMDINVPFSLLTAGTHSYYVQYSGDNNYTATEVYKSFNVSKITPTVLIYVEEDEIGVMGGPMVNVTVASDATGTVIIDNNGETVIAELTQGNYSFQIYDLQAGYYTIKVDYQGDDKYNAAHGEKVFEVPKATTNMIISDVTGNISGGQNVTFTVEMDNNFATGNLTIFVDDVETLTVALDDYASAAVSVPGLGAGNHTIGVKYDGDDNFVETAIYYFAVNVTKSNSTVTIDMPINETFDNYIEVIITVVNQTELTVKVTDQDGNVYEGQFIDGKYVLNNLPVGNYTVNVTNAENEMFNASSAVANFTIMKFDFNVDIPVNTSSTEITINTPKDATGLLLVDIDGQSYYAPVENGTATVTIPRLAPGNYTAKITYTGDDKYGNQSTTKEITVPSNLPADAVTVPATSETNSPTYSIKLPEDATGFFSVVADGKEYVAALKNGEASITVPNLAEGDHRIIVSYTGDDKYSSYYNETMLNIHIPVYKLTKNADVKVRYSATKSYSVLVTRDGKAVVGEKVTIKFNGKTYSVVTDSKGYATLKLDTKVKPKTYTITAEYKGLKVTNKVTVKNIIKIKKVKIKKTKKKAKIKVTLKKVDGKYVKGAKLKLKVNGMTFKAKTNKKGVAKFKLNKKAIKKLSKTKKYSYSVTKNMKVSVKKPKYTYKVYYGKDVAKKKVTVK